MTRPRSDDRGASLVLALVFLTVFGVVIAALLSFGQASFRVVQTVKDDGGAVYTAGGALDVAVNAVRKSTFNNTAGGGSCPTVDFPDVNGTGASTVTCSGGPGTGGSSGSNVPISSANKPGSAIYTTSTTEAGIVQGSNNDIVVHGRIFSNSAISVTPGSHLTVDNAPLYARGACSAGASGTATPTEAGTQCGLGSGTPPTAGGAAASVTPVYPAPTFASSFGVGHGVQSVPACAGNGVARMTPGIYTSASALTTLTSTGCVVWFPAGVYYFDFPTSNDTWTVGNAAATVVGGTPPTASQATTPPLPPQVPWDPTASNPTVTIPGSCRNPRLDTSNGGVEFVFGGSSHVVVTSGRMELCGQYSTSTPPIALYGLTGSSSDTTAPTMTATGAGSTTASSGTTAWTTGASAGTCTSGTPAASYRNAICADNTVSTATFANSNGATSTLNLQGFAPTTGAIPANSTLVSATLHVTHAERDSSCNGGSQLSISVIITPTSGSPTGSQTVPLRCSSAGTLGTDNVPVTSALSSTLLASGWNGGTIAYTVTGKNNSATLDAITLDMTYHTLQYEPQSGCVTVAPYTASGACALIKASGAQSSVYVEGTTYLPAAPVDVALTNVGSQVFNFGIVARTLWITLTASSGFNLPVIQIPDDDNGPVPLDVYFTVWQCPSAPPCGSVGAGGRIRLRARVTFTDPGAAVVAGQRTVTVDNVAVVR